MADKTDAMGRLRSASQGLAKAVGEKAVSNAGDRLGGLSDRLEGIAEGGPVKKAVAEGGKAVAQGESPVKGAVKGAMSGIKDKVTGGGGKGGGAAKATKATNIVEQIDVGVPVDVAYNQWTEFGAFPSFMKKVENVESEEDNKLEWKAQIFWSHRSWEATVLEQIPDERIVWRSKGEKGHVDGAVTFHAIGPNLTRILVVLEYYPQGLMERTGNLWRAQGRRVRAELKHFRRHVMTRTILEPDEVEGWRGTIQDGEVVQSHEDALAAEQEAEDEYDEADEAPADEYEEEPEDEEESEYEEEPEDEEYADEAEVAEPEDEAEDEAEEAEPEDEAEDEEYDEEPTDEEEEEAEDGEEYDEEPEDEYEEDAEEVPEEETEDEPEDEYEDEEDAEEPQEEPAERPSRSRRRRAS
jgi:uncharacterized membrane protein